MTEYRVGIYIRLSLADGDTGSEKTESGQSRRIRLTGSSMKGRMTPS